MTTRAGPALGPTLGGFGGDDSDGSASRAARHAPRCTGAVRDKGRPGQDPLGARWRTPRPRRRRGRGRDAEVLQRREGLRVHHGRRRRGGLRPLQCHRGLVPGLGGRRPGRVRRDEGARRACRRRWSASSELKTSPPHMRPSCTLRGAADPRTGAMGNNGRPCQARRWTSQAPWFCAPGGFRRCGRGSRGLPWRAGGGGACGVGRPVRRWGGRSRRCVPGPGWRRHVGAVCPPFFTA